MKEQTKKLMTVNNIFRILTMVLIGVVFYMSNHCFVMNVYYPGEGYSIVGSMLFAYGTICTFIIVRFSLKMVDDIEFRDIKHFFVKSLFILAGLMVLVCGSFGIYSDYVESNNYEEKMKYLEQGNNEEDFNIQVVLLWYGDDHPPKGGNYYTPDELNMMHNMFILKSNFTEEEFPIFDFENGTMPEFK